MCAVYDVCVRVIVRNMRNCLRNVCVMCVHVCVRYVVRYFCGWWCDVYGVWCGVVRCVCVVCGAILSSCAICHVAVRVYVSMSCGVESGMSICQYGGQCSMSRRVCR